MSTPKYDSYSNRFKAKVALEAYKHDNLADLSKKYEVPVQTIEIWADELQSRAELLFICNDDASNLKSIKRQAALLKTTLESSPNGIIVTDLNREVITYNQNSVDMWELPQEVEGRGSLKKVMPYVINKLKDPERYQEILEKTYGNPEVSSSDILELKDGRFFQRIAVPYREGNEVVGQVINFIDITQFKKAEQKLTEYSDLLQSINENVNEAILRSTPREGLIYVNDAFVSIFGYDSKEEVLATNPSEFYADDYDRNSLVDKLINNKGFKNEEVLFKRKDGSTFWGLENSTLIRNNGDIYIDGVVTDINNWKQAQEALRKSEEKYRSILRNIEEGYFETDLEGNFTFFNAALVDIMGYAADEMIGMNNREYMDEAAARKVYETFNRVYKTGRPEKIFDWQLVCGDGSRIYVEASVTLRRDAHGEPIGFSGMVRDITERREKEQQIRDSLREKEVLLGEIHHRVKNNLAVISGLLYLQGEQTDDESATRALRESQNRINSMALIHELLYTNRTFSKLRPKQYIEELVEHLSSNLKGTEANISTSIEADDFDLEMSMAIPCALIVNELVTNAYKYAFNGHDKGRIDIRFVRDNEGKYCIEVADNGRGLPGDFSIEDSGNHSLGLSLVKTLTRQLNGILSAENNNGARFTITFEA